jgi:hypothetical protein
MGTGFVPPSPLGDADRTGGNEPSREAGPRPPLFGVRAVWAGPEGHEGRGDLLVTADAVSWHPANPALGRSLTHTAPALTLSTALLAPPWANTFLVLEDHRSRVRVAASILVRRRLRRALRMSGRTLHEELCMHPPAP